MRPLCGLGRFAALRLVPLGSVVMCKKMIDRRARNKLAELLRSLASGQITNDEFEDSIPESEDKAIIEVFSNGGWCLYSDMKEYKLKGKDALEKVVKKEIARWVLFLKSNYEYAWPNVPPIKRMLHTISFGWLGTSYAKAWSLSGDVDVWPFLKVEHFSNAKEEYGYLGKQNT